jgi:hypothetical protein
VEGSPIGQVGEGGSSPELLADGKGGKTGTVAAFSDEVGALVAGVVLCRGGKEEGLRCRYTQRKRRLGVLGAPITVEWVMMAEAVEAPAIGRLLAVSSCTDGEKVMRGRRWHNGLTGGGAERDRAMRCSDSEVTALRHAWSGGATTARR